MRFCLEEVSGRAWGSLVLLYGVRFIMIINDVDEELRARILDLCLNEPKTCERCCVRRCFVSAELFTEVV